MILILLAGSSGQSILIALHQFYHLSWLRPVQPVTAAILPPLAYLAFVSSTRRRLLWLQAVQAISLLIWKRVLSVVVVVLFEIQSDLR